MQLPLLQLSSRSHIIISAESELIYQWPLLRWRVTPGSARSAHRRALLLSGWFEPIRQIEPCSKWYLLL